MFEIEPLRRKLQQISTNTTSFFLFCGVILALERGRISNPAPALHCMLKEKGIGSFVQYVRKVFRKTNISYPLIHARTCAYRGVTVFWNILRTYQMNDSYVYVILLKLDCVFCYYSETFSRLKGTIPLNNWVV